MESQNNVESTTYMGKFEFASFTSTFINLLLKRDEIALGLMKHKVPKIQADFCCSVPRAGIGILPFENYGRSLV